MHLLCCRYRIRTYNFFGKLFITPPYRGYVLAFNHFANRLESDFFIFSFTNIRIIIEYTKLLSIYFNKNGILFYFSEYSPLFLPISFNFSV